MQPCNRIYYWNNKFYYRVASCWLFLLSHTTMHGLFVIIDPNDVESPRASFIVPSKYGVNPQPPPVSPNEEDLSLVLGTMQVCAKRYKISMQFVWK